MSSPAVDKPAPYHPGMPATWWLKNRQYFLFMLRELSSVFISVFLLVFLFQIFSLSRGPEAYVAYSRALAAPGWIIFHAIALLFAVYHSVTWFQLMPQVLVIRLGRRRVAPALIFATSLVAWLVVSLAVLLLVLFLRI